jgi:hypothetical protein
LFNDGALFPCATLSGVDALKASVFFLVATSLSDEQCFRILGASKEELVRKYQLGVEQALGRANFLETEELIVLQAFTIFLMGLRNHCGIKRMWTLTALLVRLAQNAGLHRDGAHFQLSPFEIELRRRTWWTIAILDSRGSEDSGYDSAIPREGVDTQMPLNINDSDLHPDMVQLPEPRTGITEMTFSLVRFEATKSYHRFLYMPGQRNKDDMTKSLAEKAACISNFQSRLDTLFFQHCDLSDPFAWYVGAICRIKTNKMWLIAHHPYLRTMKSSEVAQDTRDVLFMAALRTLEYWLQLLTEPRTQQWRWLCETYMQWYALTFLLHELCSRTQGKLVERAWRTVTAALQGALGTVPVIGTNAVTTDRPHELPWTVREANSVAFRPIRKLLEKAWSARESTVMQEELACESAAFHEYKDAQAASVTGIDGASAFNESTVTGFTLGSGEFVSLGFDINAPLNAFHDYPHAEDLPDVIDTTCQLQSTEQSWHN